MFNTVGSGLRVSVFDDPAVLCPRIFILTAVVCVVLAQKHAEKKEARAHPTQPDTGRKRHQRYRSHRVSYVDILPPHIKTMLKQPNMLMLHQPKTAACSS